MTVTPIMYTSPNQLDGTITGMIVTVIVAALGLVILIGVVFWAANHPDIKPPKRSHSMRKVHGTARSADPHSVAPIHASRSIHPMVRGPGRPCKLLTKQ